MWKENSHVARTVLVTLFQNKARCLGFAFFSIGSHKDGYETFASWKKVWTTNGKSEPSLKAFMADQQLPFWVSGCPGPRLKLTSVLRL